MSICIPNKADREKFEALASVVGIKEAERDYFEQNGKVRPPSIVLDKINRRLMAEDKIMFDPASFTIPSPRTETDVINSVQKIINESNNKTAFAAAETMSQQLGINYKVVSQQDAAERTGSSDTKGFYQSGVVYLVEGNFTPDTVFHEFSHPIVKALANENPQLLSNLYNELLSEDYGKQIVNEMMKDSFYGKEKVRDTKEFKEEAVVRALTYINSADIPSTNSWLKNILFQLRQFLRRAFGQKVNVSKMTTSTTLQDLVKMLNQGDKFKFDMEVLSNDTALMLEKEFDNMLNFVAEESRPKAQKIIDELQVMIRGQVVNMRDGTIYHSFVEGFVSEDSSGVLQQMRRTLEKIASSNNNRNAIPGIDNLSQEYLDSLENMTAEDVIKERVSMFIGVLSQVDTVMDLFQEKINKLPTGKLTDPAQIDVMFGISQYIDQWEHYLSRLVSHDSEFLFHQGQNPLYNFLNDMKTKVQKMKNQLDRARIEGVTDILYDTMLEYREESDKRMLEELEYLKETGNTKGYDRLHQEYYGLTVEQMNRMNELERQEEKRTLSRKGSEELGELRELHMYQYKPTREQFQIMLLGGGMDANHLNIYYEGYNASQDKSVGTFFSFLEEKFNEINGNANKNEADFLNGLQEHLKATGWNMKRHFSEGRLGKALAQESNIGRYNAETGLVEDYVVYEFKSNFTSEQKVEMKILQENIQIAHDDYLYNPTVANHKKWVKERQILEDFLADYMHQDMVAEFYEPRKLFRDDIGIKARMKLDKFYEGLDELSDVAMEAHVDPIKADAIAKAWREYEYLFSLTDIYGNEKTGEELAIAKRLREYRDMKRDFYEYETNEEKFQIAYDTMLEDLKAEGIEEGTPLWEARVDSWIEHNTTVEVKEEWYDERKRLLDERSELMQPFIEANADIEDLAPLYEQIYELAKPSKDTSGQYNGTTMTKEVQIKIRDLHYRIEEARRKLFTMNGLTPEQIDDYNQINQYYQWHDEFASEEQRLAFQMYRDIISKGLTRFGITRDQIKRIFEIDGILQSMSNTGPTKHYIDTFLQIAEEDEDSKQALYEFIHDKLGIDLEAGDLLTAQAVSEVMNNRPLLEEMRSTNMAFNQWFDNNHFEAERVIKTEEGQEVQMVWNRTSLWSHTKPSSSSYYNAFALSDIDGNVIGALKDSQGIPRVPNTNYKTRRVKDEFRTQKIERDYVDANGKLVLANINNKGEWLPKTVEQGAKDDRFINPEYMKMFNEDRPMWDLLNYVKNHHLDNQEGVPYPQRLGLEYPRVRKGKLENLGIGLVYNTHENNIKDAFLKSRMGESIHNFWRTQPDDIEYDFNRAVNEDKKYGLNTVTRPITGMYDLDINEVSTDIIETIGKHQYSLETWKGLNSINSLSQTLRQMVNKQISTPEANEFQANARLLAMTHKDEGVSNRATAVNNIMEQHFQGFQLKSSTLNNSKTNINAAKMQAVAVRRFMGWSSRKWFFLNWMSDITNFLSGNVQFLYKTFDSRHFNAKNLAVGKWKAKKAIATVLAQSYQAGVKPLTLQFLDVMDASPDRFHMTIGERGSRNIAQDIYKGKWGYGVRAYLQNEVNYTALYALLDNKKYRFEFEGQMTTLDKVIELRNGVIHTKEGVPADFQITYDAEGKIVLGSKIQQAIKHHHGYLKKTTGIAGKTAESEFVNRSMLGKMMFFIMRFLPGMTMDRYQFGTRYGRQGKYVKSKTIRTRRFDWYTQTNEYGIFIEGLLSVKNLLAGTGDIATGNMKGSQVHRIYRSRASRAAIAQILAAELFNILIDMLHGGMLFYNDDDDSKFAFNPTFQPAPGADYVTVNGEDFPGMINYLKRSTALPNLPFVNPAMTSQKIGQEFNAENYWKLQLLRLSLRLERENKTFNPDRLWKASTQMLFGKSPVQEGALKDMERIAQYFLDETDSTLGQTAGPYSFQKAHHDKFLHLLVGQFLGYNGNMISPADAIESELKFKY